MDIPVRPNWDWNMLAIGVMLNSLDRDFFNAIAQAKALGFTVIHTAALPEEWLAGPERKRVIDTIRNSGMRVDAMFVGFRGQSYADIPAIKRTVGLVQPAERSRRLAIAKQYLPLARDVGAPAICLHLGFLPDADDHPDYVATVAAMRELCDEAAAHDVEVRLETGQEPASRLESVLREVNRPNLRVNFDPANFLIYGTDEPLPALYLLYPNVRSVHCKDGARPEVKGLLGEEKPFGYGEVNLERLVSDLIAMGYQGPLVIENETRGADRVMESREYLNRLLRYE